MPLFQSLCFGSESLYFFQSLSMALAMSLAAERNQFDFLRRRSLKNVGDLAFASQVHIRGFRAHGIEKRFLLALFGQVGNLNGI